MTEYQSTPYEPALSDESVDQMIALAERLKAANGGALDDSAIAAISEATGAPTEYVRLAVKVRTETSKSSVTSNLRAQYMTLEPDMRKFAVAGVSATACALLSVMEAFALERDFHYGIFGMLALVVLTLAIYSISLSRDARVAIASGAIFGGGYFAMNAIFAALFQLPAQIEAFMLVPFTVMGAIGGFLVHSFVQKFRPKLGLKDPVRERQDLLRQLVDLQEKLKSAEEHCTFLSLDIVGSTRMKQAADALSVEFTFNEYHRFIERVVSKHQGRIHSTAGDGIICAFEQPAAAFAAAKHIQTGLIELNTFRNRIGVPIQLRAAIHTGTVMTPQAGDITSVNFAHVIDIAAHLQKTAPPGGIAVSDAAAIYLPGGAASVGTQRVQVEDVSASIWVARPLPPVPQASSEQAPTPSVGT